MPFLSVQREQDKENRKRLQRLFEYLQSRCYAGPGQINSTYSSGAVVPTERIVNDTVTNYLMDNLDAYVYPNLVYALLLQTDNENDKNLQLLRNRTWLQHRAELRDLKHSMVTLESQIAAARQTNNQSLLQGLQRAKDLSNNRLARLTTGQDGYPHLTRLLKATANADDYVPPIKSAKNQRFLEDWRASLLLHIQSMCATLDNYEIVKGTGEARSQERVNFVNSAWTDACYRQNSDEDRHGVLPDDNDSVDLDVFRGIGRLVTMEDDSATTEDALEPIRNLFMAFPDCFTYERFDLTNAGRIPRPISDPHGRKSNQLIVLKIEKPIVVQRTNAVIQPGAYRLDRTIFLTIKNGNRTVAVRSNYCETDTGKLRFAERHYANANFSGKEKVLRTYYAGTANMFFAVPRAANADEKPKSVLLGYWIGGLWKTSHLNYSTAEIRYNQNTGSLPKCQTLHGELSTNYILLDEREVDPEYGLPEHTIVTIEPNERTGKYRSDAKYAVVENGLSVEYLCAAQPGKRCPYGLPPSTAPFDKHESVGAFLFFYALVYYSKHNLSSLNLYVRVWDYEVNRWAFRVASGSIANYYNTQFGLNFVPFAKQVDEKDEPWKDRSEASAEIEKEIGWNYMRKKYANVFEQSERGELTLDALLQNYAEFCNFFTLLLAVTDKNKIVHLSKVSDLPLFQSNYYALDSGEDERTLTNGRMFRHYPHLAELEMRIVNHYLRTLKRMKTNRKKEDQWDTFNREEASYKSPTEDFDYAPSEASLQRMVAKVRPETIEKEIIEPDRLRKSYSLLDDAIDEVGANDCNPIALQEYKKAQTRVASSRSVRQSVDKGRQCSDWNGWKWSKNSCAHDSLLIAMLAPEPYNPLRDDLLTPKSSDSEAVRDVRQHMADAWAQVRKPGKSTTCWNLRSALARIDEQERSLYVGGQFVYADNVANSLFKHFVAERAVFCFEKNSQIETLVRRPFFEIFVSLEETFEEKLVEYFSKDSRGKRFVIDNSTTAFNYFWATREQSHQPFPERVIIPTVRECDLIGGKIGKSSQLTMRLNSAVLYTGNHFECVFRCNNEWYHYNDLGRGIGEQAKIKLVGSFDQMHEKHVSNAVQFYYVKEMI